MLGLNPFRPCILSRWEKLGLPGFHWKLKFNAMFPEHFQSYPAQAKQSVSARANSQNKHPAWWFQLTPESVERGIMDEKIHFKHDQTTSAEWRTNENPADLWWGPWDFINSRLLLGAGVACVGFMVNYSPIIWHTLTYEKHTVSLGIWSTFIVILFHIYCILNWRVTFICPRVSLDFPRIETDDNNNNAARPTGFGQANFQASTCPCPSWRLRSWRVHPP